MSAPAVVPSVRARLHHAWWSNPRQDLLSGLVVALALIPEALAFSIIAGVDPQVGLYAACSMAIVISLVGGRSAMISGATGAIAPLTWHTLVVIAPFSVTIALVGLMESLMTAQLIDTITDTRSDKNTEARGQGIANIVTGLFGGMAGCAMIGQSMINMRNGARTRLSTLSAGVFLLVLILALAPVVRIIPMAALASVMVIVAVSTFNWQSVRLRAWRERPKSETFVMVVVVAIVVATSNLAIGVVVGVLLSGFFFARRVAHLVDVTSTTAADTRTYHVTGALFFASVTELAHDFDFHDPAPNVVVDLTDSHIWDTSAIAALDTIVAKYADRGVTATLVGLNEHSQALHARLSGRLAPSH